jgi:hypothetical protein
MAASEYVMPMTPNMMGFFSGGTLSEAILKPPTDRPAPPQPAMARPATSALELGAAPQMTLPTSKTSMDQRKHHLRLKYLNSLPALGVMPPKVMK